VTEMKIEDYVLKEWQDQVRLAKHHLSGRCPLLEDRVTVTIDDYIRYLHSRLPDADKRQYEWDKEL